MLRLLIAQILLIGHEDRKEATMDDDAKWIDWYMSRSGTILFILSCYILIYSIIALMIKIHIGMTKDEGKIKRRVS